MDRRTFLAAGAALTVAACGSGRARSGPGRRVIVIGAGLAGLVAAWELDRAGHDVTILEARDRPGGRIETVRDPFADGLYAEAGATFISDTHVLVRRYARAMELPLRRLAPRGVGEIYYVDGRRIRLDDPRAAWPGALTADERTLGLGGLWKRYVEPALDDLRDEHDQVTAAEFLRTRGASPAAIALLGLGFLDLSGEGLASYSALAMLRDFAHRRDEKASHVIEGGSDRLPRELATRLGDKIRYRRPVIRIEPGDARGAVVVQDGSTRQRLEADRIVCTIPCSVLKTIEVSPRFSSGKRRGIETLAYTSVTRVFLQTRRRVGGAQPLSLTTDGAIQWIWEASAGQKGQRGVLDAYTAGRSARRLAAMTDDERLAFVRDEVQRVQPDHGGPIELGVSKVWDADPWARGAYCWFRPGQVIGLAHELARPEGRVHFAGEHASSKPQWMEGAIESALRVVDEIGAS